MVEPQRQIVARDRIGGASGVDLVPRTGAGFAKRFHRGRLRKIVADIGTRDVAREMRPTRIGHGLTPSQSRRLYAAVHTERVRAAVGQQLAVFHDGLDPAAVCAREARAEADSFVFEHEPGLLPRERRVPCVELHAGRADIAEFRSADPGVGPARSLAIGASLIGGWRPDHGVDGRAGHAVGIDGGPIRIAVAVEIRVVNRGHAVTGVPAAHVLAVDRLEVRDPARGQAQAQTIAGTEMDDAVHLAEVIMPDQLAARHRVRVRHELLGRRQQRQRRVVDEAAHGVALRPVLDHAAHTCRIGRRRELRRLQDGLQDAVARALWRAAGARNLTPADRIPRRTAIDDRLKRVVHPLIEVRLRRIGDGPCRAGKPDKHRRHRGEQRSPVACGVGKIVVLHERAVPIEAVAGGHIRKHGAEGIAGERDLRRILHHAAAHADHASFPHFVRLRHIGRGRIEVHRVHGVSELRARELPIEQHRDVRQIHWRTDLPVPPIVVLRFRSVVAVGVHPVESAQRIRQ